VQEGVGIRQGIVMGSDDEMGKIPRFNPLGGHVERHEFGIQ
jgi:hypothetical protein